MVGPCEVSLIARNFGNGGPSRVAAASTRLMAELNAAAAVSQPKASDHQHKHIGVTAVSHKKQSPYPHLSDEDMMQVLFTKMDSVPHHGLDLAWKQGSPGNPSRH